MKNKSSVIEPILNAGFPINETVREPRITALMLCASEGAAEATQLVLQYQPDLNARDTCNRTALHYACKGGHLEIVKLFFDLPNIRRFVDLRTDGGDTPLMMAVQSGNPQVVGACLNIGCNPFLVNKLQQGPVDYASQFPAVLGQNLQHLVF